MLKNLNCSTDLTLLEALQTMNGASKDILFITSTDQRLIGVLSDGDIRRALLKGNDLSTKVVEVVNTSFEYALTNDTPDQIRRKFSKNVTVIPIVDGDFKLVSYQEAEHGSYPVAVPDLKSKEFKYLVDAYLSGWISSTGQYVLDFEKAFSNYIGTEHGISCSNGTTALHLALLALEVGAGDEVIVPDLTFAATINSVLHAGATPVIVDIDRTSWNIDPREFEKAITPKTKAVIIVHLYGQPCQMDEILAICKKHNIFLIEDCAEAHGAEFEGSKVGSFGDISCFSFFANKIITTGEGGMCLTNDLELADRMRIFRDHGMNRSNKYYHEVVGYNYRITNLQAAIGLAQVERIDEIMSARDGIENMYYEIFRDVEELEFQRRDLTGCRKVNWLVSGLWRGQDKTRDDLISSLAKDQINCRPFFYSLGEMPLYQGYCFSNRVSKEVSRQGICFPTYNEIDREDIEWLRRKIS